MRFPVYARSHLWRMGGHILLLVLLLWLWPYPLGGSTVYAVLKSDSMRPRFHRGDIVIARRAPWYQPGDIVVYRSHRVPYVFHRIVGYDSEGRFLTKGDANSYIDPDHPTVERILGRYVAHVPYLGWLFLIWGHIPGWVLMSVSLTLLLWPTMSLSRRQRWRKRWKR